MIEDGGVQPQGCICELYSDIPVLSEISRISFERIINRVSRIKIKERYNGTS